MLARYNEIYVFVSHDHPDHFDGAAVEQYRKQTLRPVLGPENLPCGTTTRGVSCGWVSVLPIKSRHIGKEYFHIPHVSYDIEGSKTVWFLGDAVPSQWHGIDRKCHVLIAPFAYALTESAWRMTCELADHVVLVHMPLREDDPAGLWPQVEKVTGARKRLITAIEIIIIAYYASIIKSHSDGMVDALMHR